MEPRKVRILQKMLLKFTLVKTGFHIFCKEVFLSQASMLQYYSIVASFCLCDVLGSLLKMVFRTFKSPNFTKKFVKIDIFQNWISYFLQTGISLPSEYVTAHWHCSKFLFVWCLGMSVKNGFWNMQKSKFYKKVC